MRHGRGLGIGREGGFCEDSGSGLCRMTVGGNGKGGRLRIGNGNGKGKERGTCCWAGMMAINNYCSCLNTDGTAVFAE